MEKHASSLGKIGVKVGFFISYILSSLLLFYILVSLGKISYSAAALLKVFIGVLLITALGGLIKKFVL
ncbi:MAG: hypothetical protein AABX24_02360 [Nanoarchaeota archaeon]